MPKKDLILLAMEASPTLDLLERALRSAGYELAEAKTPGGLEKALIETIPTLLVISEKLGDKNGLDLAATTLERFPTLPIIYYASTHDPKLVLQAMRAGLSDYLYPPLKIEDIVRAIQHSQRHARQMGDWVRSEVRRTTASLEDRVSELDTLLRLSRSITSSLDLNSVLTSVVSAAVKLTGAEEGHLLLPDATTQELYMRAGRNYEESFARTFRVPVKDSLAGRVMETGQAISFSEDSPNKIKTSYLVYSLIYVPISSNGRVLGVMGVDNRSAKRPFTQHHELLMKVLADFASIAIQNAQLYAESQHERVKFETTITHIQDGVILLDDEQRISLINPAARKVFGLGLNDLKNQPVLEAIPNNDFNLVLESVRVDPLKFREIGFEDGRVFNTQYTPIPDVGAVITLEDITHLKMLDRLKSDFIHTISHDLRSPLTAIVGYVELLDRVGSLNDQQKEFVRHIQNSANNITELINDLLDLGRIEAGFDARMDDVSLGTILHYTLDNLGRQIADKHQNVIADISPDLPILRGNPLRLRQIIDNLLVNAIKYTPEYGEIRIGLHGKADQIIFEVADSGIGIPPE
ncbi:MAG TPA: histidine kinase dimerization/phospho-acceptor domain-containing protein, partial [Anaerolineales bacterium]